MQVRFPSTEEDCKKVLSFHKKREGASHYTRPILSNFVEAFDSGVMTILYKSKAKGSRFKVEEAERYTPIHAKPNPETLRKSAEIMHYSSRDGQRHTIEQIMEMMTETQNRAYDAIGQALLKA